MRERDNPAWLYLTKERGLRPFWIKQFQLGWVREPLPGHEKYLNRISIPYRTGLGEPRGLRFRALDGIRPKYEGDAQVATHLFAPKYAAEKLVYVTEGEFNTIILHQIGLRGVGVPGSNNFKREYRWTFRYAEHVVGILDGDGDRAGAAAFKTKLAQHLHSMVPMLTFIQMPRRYDVNSLYLKDRRELQRLLQVA